MNESVAAGPKLRQSLRALAHELTLAETRERDRMARELHDGLGQLLAAARFKVTELRHCPAAQQVPVLDELTELLAQAARATRSATFDLSSPVLHLGLDEALRGLAERLTRSAGPLFRVDGSLGALPVSEAVLSVLYRVVRELALNVQRHAHARRAHVRLEREGPNISICVSDDGIGIEPEQLARGLRRNGGFGLGSAHAQMQALGGSLVVETGTACGTVATVSLRLESEGRP